jgi:hypothetical protein
MSQIRVTYVAIDEDGNKPILSAESFEDLKRGLDEYYGIGKTDAKCLGFNTYITKYPDEYEGYYEYRYTNRVRNFSTDEFETVEGTDTIRVYCIDFYPHTTIVKYK